MKLEQEMIKERGEMAEDPEEVGEVEEVEED